MSYSNFTGYGSVATAWRKREKERERQRRIEKREKERVTETGRHNHFIAIRYLFRQILSEQGCTFAMSIKAFGIGRKRSVFEVKRKNISNTVFPNIIQIKQKNL